MTLGIQVVAHLDIGATARGSLLLLAQNSLLRLRVDASRLGGKSPHGSKRRFGSLFIVVFGQISSILSTNSIELALF